MRYSFVMAALVYAVFFSVSGYSQGIRNPHFYTLRAPYNDPTMCGTFIIPDMNNGSRIEDYTEAWFVPTMATPDYFHVCSKANAAAYWGNVPINGRSFVSAGQPDGGGAPGMPGAYGGILLTNTKDMTGRRQSYREYISQEIIGALEVGKTYTIKFKMALGVSDANRRALKKIGLYLTASDPRTLDNNPGRSNAIPISASKTIGQYYEYVDNTGAGIKRDVSPFWYEEIAIQVTIEESNKHFITIGHFDDSFAPDNYVPALPVPEPPVYALSQYYFIDDVLIEGMINCTCDYPTNTVIKKKPYNFMAGQCCYEIQISNSPYSCPLLGFRIKDKNGTLLHTEDFSNNPLLASALETRTFTVCFSEFESENKGKDIDIEYITTDQQVCAIKSTTLSCLCNCNDVYGANSAKNLNIELKPNNEGGSTHCCWDIVVTNNNNCNFKVNGFALHGIDDHAVTGYSFQYQHQNGSTEGYLQAVDGNNQPTTRYIQANQKVTIGKICVETNSTDIINIAPVINGTTECSHQIFTLSCGPSPTDCCSGIRVTATKSASQICFDGTLTFNFSQESTPGCSIYKIEIFEDDELIMDYHSTTRIDLNTIRDMSICCPLTEKLYRFKFYNVNGLLICEKTVFVTPCPRLPRNFCCADNILKIEATTLISDGNPCSRITTVKFTQNPVLGCAVYKVRCYRPGLSNPPTIIWQEEGSNGQALDLNLISSFKVCCFKNLPTLEDLDFVFEFFDENGTLMCTKDITISPCYGHIEKGTFENEVSKQENDLKASLYPNPANSTVTISLPLSTKSQVKIELLNSVGQSISLVRDQMMSANEHSILVNTENLAKGAYFIRITTPDASQLLPLYIERK